MIPALPRSRTATRPMLVLAMLLFTGSTLAACGPSTVRVRGEARVATDRALVHVGNGVWVVEDYDRPVFYADDYYWLYRDGVWYRSSYYDGGWGYVEYRYVPRVVRGIERPRRYVRYQRRSNTRVRALPRRSIVRDHRDRRVIERRRAIERRRDIRRDRESERRQNARERRIERRQDARERRIERRQAPEPPRAHEAPPRKRPQPSPPGPRVRDHRSD